MQQHKLQAFQWNLLAILSFFLLFSIFFFERIPVVFGLGWDGTTYYKIAADFKHKILSGEITAYFFQRSFPLALTHYVLKTIDALGRLMGFTPLAPTIPAVMNCFFVWNTIAIIGSNYYLFKIYDRFEFEKKLQILCFLLFNLTFPIAKLFSYYPVLTDYMAIFIATASFYAYIFNKPRYLLLLFLIGYFTFPTLFLVISILFIFPYNTTQREFKIALYQKYKSYIHVIVSILIVCFYIYKTKSVLAILEQNNWVMIYNESPMNIPLIPISIFLASLYIVGIIFLFYRTDLLQKLIEKVNIIRVVSIFAIYFILSQSIYYLCPEEGIGNAFFIDNLVVRRSIKEPLIFHLSGYFYFGISFMLPFLYHKYWNKIIEPIGIGAMAVLFLHFALMMGSESRQFIAIFPFTIIFSGLLLQKLFIVDNKTVILLGSTSFLLSTVWLPINQSSVDKNEMPYLYAIHQGPWMPSEFYYFLVLICVGMMLALKFILKAKAKEL